MEQPADFRALLQRNWRTVVATFAILLDLTVHAISFLTAGALYLETYRVEFLLTTYSRLLVFSSFVFLMSFTMSGIYRTLSYSSFGSQVYKAAKAYVYSTAIIVSVVYFFGKNLFYTPRFFELFLIVFPSFYMFVWSTIRGASEALRQAGFGSAKTIAIGSDPDFKKLLDRLSLHPELGYNVVSVLKTAGRDARDGVDHVDVKAVEELVESQEIDQIVFSSSYQLNGSFAALQDICRRNGISMRIVSPESDLLFTKARLHDVAGIPVFMPGKRRVGRVKTVVKRFFDIVGASIVILLLTPLFAVVAAAITIESRGPVFFKQRRSLGADDTPFDFIKFRSMRAGADREKELLEQHNESDGALFKMKDDPRITRVGRIIRKYSIDELPQLFNVLKGDMSLVGPRPLPVKDYEKIEEDDHLGGYMSRRARVKPGMTGLWQVSGRSDLGFREMVLLDLYYVENHTLLFDIEILAQTVPVVVFGRGAY